MVVVSMMFPCSVQKAKCCERKDDLRRCAGHTHFPAGCGKNHGKEIIGRLVPMGGWCLGAGCWLSAQVKSPALLV